MADRPQDARSRGADPLEPLDPDLTIFALANGLDLERESQGAPCRILVWYREGLERSIRIDPAGDDAASVRIHARSGRSSAPGEVHRDLRPATPIGELTADLRKLLAEALERANGLAEDDLA